MRWLRPHADATTLAAPTARRAAWLTGQSSWSHSRLSRAQEAVLDDLERADWEPLRLGFPWTTTAQAPVYRPVPLPVASVRNTAQGLAARPGTELTAQVAWHVQQLLDATGDDLLLLCGSAGGRMLGAAQPLLRVPEGLRVSVVALAPVGPLPVAEGPWRVHVVRGERDWVSALGYRGPLDRVVPGGHLRSATSAEAVAAVLDLVGSRVSPAPARR